jgi:hypothetical protein
MTVNGVSLSELYVAYWIMLQNHHLIKFYCWLSGTCCRWVGRAASWGSDKEHHDGGSRDLHAQNSAVMLGRLCSWKFPWTQMLSLQRFVVMCLLCSIIYLQFHWFLCIYCIAIVILIRRGNWNTFCNERNIWLLYWTYNHGWSVGIVGNGIALIKIDTTKITQLKITFLIWLFIFLVDLQSLAEVGTMSE